MKTRSQSTTCLPSYTTLNKYFIYAPHKGVLYSRTERLPFMNSIYTSQRSGMHKLHSRVHPLYKELGPQPWFVDINKLLSRNQHEHPTCIFDIIYTLKYRKPPPGPVFFYPSHGNAAVEILKFYSNYNADTQPSKQLQENGTQGYNYFMHQIQRFHWSDLCWFHPQTSKITWEPEHCRWRGGGRTAGMWNYHILARRMGLDLELTHLIPKLANETNRIQMALAQRRVPWPEHSRDPYWFEAFNQHRSQIIASPAEYDAQEDFATWLTD